MKGVIETTREEGMRSLLLKQLSRKLGTIPDEIKVLLTQLDQEKLDALSEVLFDLTSVR
ncbi:DUF4351 domain-containing protein [Pseudanabaena sp. CCNP1317]|nr:DUF4351 domain-containing protein [Pseudanabaena sp. CCNP1317]MEA5487517.1 DUF4351 domain-containing protein [Pseudanabaena sp. CCNP1317]